MKQAVMPGLYWWNYS